MRHAVLALLLLSVEVRAEWLTLVGIAEPESDYVQVEVDTVRSLGDSRELTVRVNRSKNVQGVGGISYRSFEGTVSVDCLRRRARYVRGSYFSAPELGGVLLAERHFSKQDDVPLRFAGFGGNPASRVIRAACMARSD